MDLLLCMKKIHLRKCVWKREPVYSSWITKIYCQNVTQECVDSVFGNNELKRKNKATLFYLHQCKCNDQGKLKCQKKLKLCFGNIYFKYIFKAKFGDEAENPGRIWPWSGKDKLT